MEPGNIAIINSHLEYIVLNMDKNRTLDHLLSTGTLTNPIYTRIMRISHSDDANRELLDILKQTPGAYGKFIDALYNTQQFELVARLQTTGNNSAQMTGSASIPAFSSNSGAQLRDIRGGTVNINISHGNMHTSGASGQQSTPFMQSALEASGGRSAHYNARSMPQLNRGSDGTSPVEEFDAAFEMENILSKYDQLPKEKTYKLKRVLPPTLVRELDDCRIQFAMIDMQDLVNNYMPTVLPDSAIKKIKSAIDNSNGAYELCESLKRSSILALLTFLKGLESTKQDHLFHSFCSKTLCHELLSILDNA